MGDTVGTMSRYARSRGLSRNAISKAYKQGVLDGALIRRKGRRGPLLNFEQADRLRAQRQLPNLQDLSESTAEKSNFAEARTWSERYRAAERKLNFEIKQGLWLQKQAVKEECFKAGRLCRDTLQNVPDRIAAIVAAETDEDKVREILQKEVETAITDYIQRLSAK